MTGTYEMSFEVPMEMLRRAMTSWAKPKRPLVQKLKRLGVLVFCGALAGVLIGVSGVLDRIPDAFVFGTLVGFYIGLMFWWIMNRRDLKRLSGFVATQLEKRGQTHAKFSAEAVEMTTNLSSARSSWGAYDQVILMADATALRSGGVIYPFPHAALPEGVDAATFHADLVRWQKAAQ